MKSKTTVLIGGLLVALLVLGVVGATSVYAQSASGTLKHGRGPGDGRGPIGGPGLEAAAQVLGMTTDELTTALQGGKTLEQVAQEKGVDFADVQAAMQKARDTEMRARIQQALDDGTITQENADWLLEGLDKGFLNGPGGFGLGGPHGPGFGSGPDQAPADGAQPTSTR